MVLNLIQTDLGSEMLGLMGAVTIGPVLLATGPLWFTQEMDGQYGFIDFYLTTFGVDDEKNLSVRYESRTSLVIRSVLTFFFSPPFSRKHRRNVT